MAQHSLTVNSMRMMVLVVLSTIFSGCATQKKLIKGEDGKREAALRVFKEGADLLYVDNEQALLKFDRATSIDESFVPAYFNAGVALEAMNRLADAAKRYEQCLAREKEQPNCLANLLLVKAKLKETADAHELIDRYLTEYKDAPFVMVAAGKLAYFEKDHARAESQARAAIERDAENVEALFLMARIFYDRKQFHAAKWVLKNALELAPSHGGLHLILGHTEMALDLSHDAIESYENAVLFHPTEEALESYALLLLKRGRANDAVLILERLLKLRPDLKRTHLHLGNAYFANREFDKAKVAYEKVLELDPTDKDLKFNFGLLYFNLKPQDLSEIERLKTAQNYFAEYLREGNVPKERVSEVKNYLETLAQKIEAEEYAAQAEKEAQERAREEEEKPKEEELPVNTDDSPKDNKEEE